MKIREYGTETFGNVFKPIDEEETVDNYYNVFKTWYLGCGLSSSGTDVPSKTTFVLIFNEFCERHIAYEREDFKRHFANELYTYYKEFEKTTEAIDNLMSLTDAQIAENDFSILNIANVPETQSSTDIETTNFISQQQKTINKKGALQIKKEQLSSKKVYTVNTFLKHFKKLFIKVLIPAYTQVFAEEIED